MIPFKPHSGNDNVGNRWWLPGTGGWGVDVTVKRETEMSCVLMELTSAPRL